MNEMDILLKGAEALRNRLRCRPRVAVVLGSGLGQMAEECDLKIPYAEIYGLKASTVSGHRGCFALKKCASGDVLFMMGRVHCYEGLSAPEAVRPVRLMRLQGIEKLILTNVSGAIDPDFKVGEPVMISGHIASLVPSPLRGENISELGTRFPDMSEVYSKRLLRAAKGIFAEAGIKYREGVYLQAPGPQYETPEEIRMFSRWGADMVGMSTAIEAIAAKHAGMEIAGVSLISNFAAGITDKKLSHEEVREAAKKGAEKFEYVVSRLIDEI